MTYSQKVKDFEKWCYSRPFVVKSLDDLELLTTNIVGENKIIDTYKIEKSLTLICVITERNRVFSKLWIIPVFFPKTERICKRLKRHNCFFGWDIVQSTIDFQYVCSRDLNNILKVLNTRKFYHYDFTKDKNSSARRGSDKS